MILRSLFRVIALLLILSSPITFTLLINAIHAGVTCALWWDRRIDENIGAFTRELDQSARFNAFSVPGALSFREFQDQNTLYQVTRLRSDDWATKLGLLRPAEYLDGETFGIDKLASLDGLVRDVNCVDSPSERWIYISEWHWDGATEIYDPWSEAFHRLIPYSYAHDSFNASQLAFLDCTKSGFLCGFWGVRAPTLLHMLTLPDAPLEEDLDPELTYPIPQEDMRQVEMRVIELPLDGAIYTGLPTDAFPEPYEQLLAIVSGDRLYEQFELWYADGQTMRRFFEYRDRFVESKGSLLYYLNEYDKWVTHFVTEPLGIEDTLQQLFTMSFDAAMTATMVLVNWPIRFATDLWRSFAGAPHPAIWGTLAEEPKSHFESLFGGAMEQVMKGAELAGRSSKVPFDGETPQATPP